MERKETKSRSVELQRIGNRPKTARAMRKTAAGEESRPARMTTMRKGIAGDGLAAAAAETPPPVVICSWWQGSPELQLYRSFMAEAGDDNGVLCSVFRSNRKRPLHISP